MPGLYRSPGLADIDVCFGKRRAGTEALKRTSRRYEDETAVLGELMQRPRRSVTLPLPGSFKEDDDDDARDIWAEEGSRVEKEESRNAENLDASMHGGYGDRRPEETGLPPTPPGAMSSDEPQEPQPLFADGVRNALSSQKSGALSTTPVNPQLSPPTPDTTPPAHAQDSEPAIRREQTPEVAFLEPVLEDAQNRPSSRPQLESFKTARETLPVVEDEQTDDVHLPDSDRLPDHWLDDVTTKPDFTGGDVNIVNSDDFPTSGALDEKDRTVSPTPPRTRYRFESPRVEREAPDWDKHISYVSGPDELDIGDLSQPFPEMKEGKAEPVAGLGVSGVEMEQRQRSAEDINNSVYKQIQQENIRRENAISTRSGAIRAGILLPSADSTPKSVRRRAKCNSLRDGPASEGGKRRSVDGGEHILKHEKRHLPSRIALQESPVLVRKRGHGATSLESSTDIRQVSSPARLGPNASRQATATLASKIVAGPTEEDIPRAHRLKRQSHGDRLSKNMSVRRTSQEISPSDLEEAFNRIDRGAASVRKQKIPSQQRTKMDAVQTAVVPTPPLERQSQMNQGVKRSKPPGAVPPPPIRLRKVIPSITSEPEAPSSPRQVRRFSREERLENNDQLRRFSTGQSSELDKVPSIDRPSEHGRKLSSDSTARRASQDPSLLSSPRKSMDARFLHPTTTPMSTSGFSDRTADIEVCEASGVRIYPHNNNSLLVVQQGSRPVSKDKDAPNGPTLADIKPNIQPIFAAQIDPPTPVLGTSNPEAHVDSPLTNPRAAPHPPEPPSIQFIPPTPNEELDRELGGGLPGEPVLRGQVNLPGRQLSFKQRVRRYSDSFFGRSTSFRKTQRQLPPRDTHLSPMWRPQRFWDDDYDSEDSYEDDYGYEPESDILPPGGDTSHFDDDDAKGTGKKRPLFPRAMSKRLPSFRGKSGFLQGNSLGIDRHGTNNRRHYVSTNSRTLSKRASDEVLQNLSAPSSHAANSTRPLPRAMSHESMSRLARSQGFKVPFTGGMRAKWVGTQAFRQKMREVRVAREEREREKRREQLKGRIGMRVYHGQ